MIKTNLRYTPILLLLFASCELASAQAQATATFDPGMVVARVGKAELTLGDLREIVQRREMYRSNPAEDEKRRIALLDGLIDDQLVSAEARSLSMKNKNGALARVRRGVTMTAANLYVREIVSQQLNLDSATIDTFYNNHIARYSTPRDQRRLRVLTVWKEGKRPGQGMVEYHDALYSGWYPEDKIDSLYTRLSEGEDFALLADQHSEDPVTRGRGGDLGWVSEQSFGSGPFAERVMKQPLHMISKPFETDEAWHIAQATGDRPAGPVALDAEISADIVSNLIKQQQDKMLREVGDSLLAAATLDWRKEYDSLPHDQLRKEMVLVVVNRRDTIFAEEFLQEESKWLDRATLAVPEPERRAKILRSEYVRYACWFAFLREKGYTERPEVVARRDWSLQEEREALVRMRIGSAPVPEPDSSTIRRYYQDSVHLYGTGPNALTLAWNAIKAKLISDANDEAHRHWRQAASARHGATRYDDRLALLPLVEQQPKKQ